MVDKRERCYIVKEPGEQLHEVFVADSAEGKLWSFSKIEPDAEISYKIYVEDSQKQVKILVTGKGSAEEYRQKLDGVALEKLQPGGNQWRSVEPVIIEK